MLHLGRTDTEGQCAHRAMRRGMRVTANNRHTRQGRALLRADDVYDALANVVDFELGDTEGIAVFVQSLDLQARHGVGDARIALRTLGRRHVVVTHRQISIDAPHGTVVNRQAFKCLRAGHLVQKLAINVNQRHAVLLLTNHVHVPKFVV